MLKEQEEYKRRIIKAGIFFRGPTKGSFILPDKGYKLWESIKNYLEKKFTSLNVKNVLLPTLIPIELIEKEKRHISGFNPEFFTIGKIGNKEVKNKYVLRPTSEVLFYEWFRETLQSHHQLPFLYNQWCSVFRAEKNTSPFFRNSEFFWQEGHTLHSSSREAKQWSKKIWKIYQNYIENVLCLKAIKGIKSKGEKFAGSLKSYTIECLLEDGQCLQLATSHYFGNKFCEKMGIKFQNEKNVFVAPFSTSWGTSTRSIGAVTKNNWDEKGLIIPFDVAPVQIGLIKIEQETELEQYSKKILQKLRKKYRCEVYADRNFGKNLAKADAEGCVFKIIIGKKDIANNSVTVIVRDKLKIKEEVQKEKIAEFLKNKAKDFKKRLKEKNSLFLERSLLKVETEAEIIKEIKNGEKKIFLINFCDKNNCEEILKKKIVHYSIRCLEKVKKMSRCLFCERETFFQAFVGRSY